MSYPKVFLKHGKEASVKRFHPWIFSGAIHYSEPDPEDGDIVEVYSSDRNFLAMGHFHHATIAVRILSFDQETASYEFFNQKIQSAIRLRYEMFGKCTNTNVFRLIHGEGDGLPGLVADYYNGAVILQFHSYGMFRHRDIIAEIVLKNPFFKVDLIYDKSANTLHKKYNPEDKLLYGKNETKRTVSENGCLFNINWIDGQKTGFFIDQRENRTLLQNYCDGKTVANVFGYTGGFSVYAFQGGAQEVWTIDSSQKAIEMATENMLLNSVEQDRHSPVCADAFDFLSEIHSGFDIIIIDPPAFAKHNTALGNALQAYKRLNQKAIEKIRPGGYLFTFSCSQAVSVSQFRQSVFVACANTRRNFRILHQMGQPPDHPVSIFHPEGEYLKGLVLQVD